MAVTDNTSKLFYQLAAAAAALPCATAFAEELPAKSIDFAYHAYQEDDIKDVNDEDFERYDIQVFQTRYTTPISDQKAVSLSLTVDSMSGSSPWYVRPDNSDGGDPDTYSSPSKIEDTRYDINASITDYGDNEPGQPQFITSANAGVSKEDDYLGLILGLSQSYEFWGRNLRLSYGGDVGHDTVSPESIAGNPVIDDETKNRYNAFISLAMVATPQTQVSLGIAATKATGYLTDPYKRVFILDLAPGGLSTSEARPDDRTSGLINLDFRHYYPDSALALLGGYRYFEDNWGLDAHTFDFDWVKTFGAHELLWGVRYYSQRAADFYSPYFSTTPESGHYTSDYRLADFAALGLRLGYAINTEKSRFQIRAERYDAGSVSMLQSRRFVNENDALVDFWRVSFEMSYKL